MSWTIFVNIYFWVSSVQHDAWLYTYKQTTNCGHWKVMHLKYTAHDTHAKCEISEAIDYIA